MLIQNKVKTLKTTAPKDFLSWEFNNLKDSNRDVTKLKNAIRKSGWSFPVIVWNNKDRKYVIDGTGRKKAVEEMIQEGDEIKEIPYVEIEAENLEEAKLKALEVSSQFGNITRDSFIEFTKDLELDFNDFNIDGISADTLIENDERDDEVPETPITPKSKLGDLYELGEHRVLCGDSSSIKDLQRLMSGVKADMVFTDPPYNVNYAGTGKNTQNTILNDKMSDENFDIMLSEWFKRFSENTKEGGGWYVFHSSSTQDQFRTAIEKTGWKVKTQIIWNKPNASMGWGDYRMKHEPMFYCGKENTQFYGDRTNTSIWDFHKSEEDLVKWAKRLLRAEKEGKTTIWSMKRENVNGYVHPTQKPVELITFALFNSSKSGDVILDLFGGSGSTMLACEKTGRMNYSMELDPKYIDVIVQRYVDYVDTPMVKCNGIDTTHLWNKTKKMN